MESLQKELWLVRDPYGIKPLYVAQQRGQLFFASQARALAWCVGTRELEPAAQVGFYLWGYVPEPFSWWKTIEPLAPGHIQRIRVGQKPSPPTKYTVLEDAYLNRPCEGLSERELRDIIIKSVRYHLVADVPVGIFLSAGLNRPSLPHW